jgi:3-methyl-2-oxobutanoate hydroxymethyltransferase
MARITIPDILRKKEEGKKIIMLTAYDYPFAKIVDEAGMDIVLVGDSLGMVVQGRDTTLSVTMEEMLYHTRMVTSAVKNALVIADMPFLSNQMGVSETIKNAGRFLKEARAAGVKLEGGVMVADQIRALVRAEIPVMAHVGMTPQSIHRFGGYKVQGKEKRTALKILEDATAVEEAGAFAVVLEAVPMAVARSITGRLKIPTIGIGAGAHCDGQVLVLYDLLGLFEKFMPKFAKQYANLRTTASQAIRRYKEEVESGKFPTKDESYP